MELPLVRSPPSLDHAPSRKRRLSAFALHARLPPGGVQSWRAYVSTRPAGVSHPWGAISCRKAAPLTYTRHRRSALYQLGKGSFAHVLGLRGRLWGRDTGGGSQQA